MIINHNISALNTVRVLKVSQGRMKNNMEQLSSGLRINKAGDDPSGLAVSEKMKAQVRGLNQASRNASDGISLIQTAEGYLEETQDIVQRLRELAVQSANGIYTDEDRDQIQVEVRQLVDEVDRVADQAEFNGLDLLTGRFGKESVGNEKAVSDMWFHVGPNTDQRVRIYIGSMKAQDLGLRDAQDPEKILSSLATADSANKSIAVLDNALSIISKQRADLGGYQNRLDMAVKGLDIGAENLQAAESRIRDLDMARGVVALTRNSILAQAGVAMLAQANQQGQQVLRLLQ